MVAACALVLGAGAVVRQMRDRGGVALALRAVDVDRVVLLARSLLGILGAERLQDVEDLAALAERLDDVVGVGAGSVHLRLMTVVERDAELLDGLGELLLEVLGVARAAAERIGHVGIGVADVLLHVVAHGGDVLRNLAEAVEIVPREQQAHLLALRRERTRNEERRRHIAEVADVHGSGRADARRANVLLLVGLRRDDLVCYYL